MPPKKHKKRLALRAKGKTAPDTHVPIMVQEVIASLNPASGQTVVDCTLGYGGHAKHFIKRIGPTGKFIGLDVDGDQLNKTRCRFKATSGDLRFHRRNFAEIEDVLHFEGSGRADVIFADIGVSSMQVDDASRGISYKSDGPLDMRMDQRLTTTGTDLLATLSQQELSKALSRLSDEPDHEIIANCIVGQRTSKPIATTSQLVRLVLNAKGMTERTWKKQQRTARFGQLHPAARTFQTLRIMVNDEIGSLQQLLQAAPKCLKPGGRIGIICFHSGEDRLVKNNFRKSCDDGIYKSISKNALMPRTGEIVRNPRCASAKFRWAIRSDQDQPE